MKLIVHWMDIVFYEFWTGGVSGPFFFEDANEKTVTATGELYKQIVEYFL